MSQFNGVGEQPAILVEGLTKSFGEVHALRGIDLSVPRGTVLGVLGPNGAGKTTAVRILTTLLLPDGGRAVVQGHDVVREAAAVRRSIGLAGQSAAIQEELTGRENLEIIGRLYHLPRPETRGRAVVPGTGLPDVHRDPAGDVRAAVPVRLRRRDPGQRPRRLVADTGRMAVTIAIIVGVGYAVGFRFLAGAGPAVAMVVLATVFGVAIACVAAFTGLAIGDEESVQAFGLIWLFPLTFVSSAFVPITSMPGWLAAFANHQPVTYVINAMRAMALGGPLEPTLWPNLWKALAWLAGTFVVFLPLAVRAYRRASL